MRRWRSSRPSSTLARRASVSSPATASPCFRRWKTLLATVFGEILPWPMRDVEVVGLAEAHLADDVGEQRRASDPLRRQAALADRVLELLAPAALGVLAALALQEGADLVARPAGPHHRQPVARGPALLLRGQDLDDVAGLELVVQRDDLAVHLRPDAAMADVGVNGVGEVERGRAGGEVLDLTLRREHEHLVLEQVDLQRLEELGRVLVALRLEQLPQPGHLLPARGRPCGVRPPCR